MEIQKKDFNFFVAILGTCIIVGSIIIGASFVYGLKHSGVVSSGSLSDNTILKTQDDVKKDADKKISKSNVPYLGQDSAKVTIVEYADYRCPFCQKFFNEVFPSIKSQYIDTGKVKFVYQDFAFLGPDSITAGEAAHCASDQGAFWQYHDYLFKNQGSESSDWASISHQKEFAKTLGLDMTKFNSCLDSGKYKQEVNNETSAGGKYGVNGTPAFLVNGKLVVGAIPFSDFQKIIEEELK